MISWLTMVLLLSLQEPHHAMNDRGAKVMGFDQQLTVHHFHLYDDGGAIDIAVKDAANAADRDAIRSHLPHIATMFAAGNFEAPMLIHDSARVPGVALLAARRDRIRYTYTETPNGGRVEIATTDPSARAALHQFLRYQIAEHRTGDSTEVTKRR